jgi:prevent-host-death family protein
MKRSATRIGVFDAKARLSELIDRALSGETIVVTRHGRPVVRLVPESGAATAASALSEGERWLRRVRARREGHPLGPGLTIRQLIDEGRR